MSFVCIVCWDTCFVAASAQGCVGMVRRRVKLYTIPWHTFLCSRHTLVCFCHTLGCLSCSRVSVILQCWFDTLMIYITPLCVLYTPASHFLSDDAATCALGCFDIICSAWRGVGGERTPHPGRVGGRGTHVLLASGGGPGCPLPVSTFALFWQYWWHLQPTVLHLSSLML